MMPPRTVLAATDFSNASISALAYAARLATHCRAALHVLHVKDAGPDVSPGHSTVDTSESTRREMQRVIMAAAPNAGCSLHVHTMTGRPADVILETAQARRADVVLVGGQNLADPKKPGFGSTIDELLRRAPIAVIVVPAGWKAPRMTAPMSFQLPKEVKPVHRPATGWKRLVRLVDPPAPPLPTPVTVRADRAPLLVPAQTATRAYTFRPVGTPYRMVSLGNAPVLMYMG